MLASSAALWSSFRADHEDAWTTSSSFPLQADALSVRKRHSKEVIIQEKYPLVPAKWLVVDMAVAWSDHRYAARMHVPIMAQMQVTRP